MESIYTQLDDDIHNIPNVYKKNGAYNGSALNSKKNKHIIDNVKEVTDFLKDTVKLAERIYCIVNKLYEYPTCACGGKITLFYNEGGRKEYADYCSRGCPAKRSNSAEYATGRTPTQASKDKQKETILERYGVDNYFKAPDFIKDNYNDELVAKRDANRKIAVQEKYGVDNVFMLDNVKEKIKDTNIDKYGFPNYAQINMSDDTLEKINSYDYTSGVNKLYNPSHIGRMLSVHSTTVMAYYERLDIVPIKHNETACEVVIREILDACGVLYEQNYTKLLGGRKHVDFYIPSHKLAIECNGLYWHSEAIRTDVNFHQEKYELCTQQGIQLIQFWEHDIYNNTDVIASFIKNKLGYSKKIYGRKCKTIKIDANTASLFVIANHLQPLKTNSIHQAYGLYYNDELCSVMTFNNTNKPILSRFCTKKNHVVVGGFSKLLKHVISTNNFNTITSYSDCMYSTGNIYHNTGFIDVTNNASVSYYYTDNFTSLVNKRVFRKDNIKKMYPMTYSPNKTEREMTAELGFTRVNGCIIKTWVLEL